MNSGYIGVFLILTLIAMQEIRKKNIIKHLFKVKFGGIEMEEIIKSYIDKSVDITLLENGIIMGDLISYNDGWLTCRDIEGKEKAINCNYVVKIEESKYFQKMKEKKEKRLEKAREKGKQ